MVTLGAGWKCRGIAELHTAARAPIQPQAIPLAWRWMSSVQAQSYMAAAPEKNQLYVRAC